MFRSVQLLVIRRSADGSRPTFLSASPRLGGPSLRSVPGRAVDGRNVQLGDLPRSKGPRHGVIDEHRGWTGPERLELDPRLTEAERGSPSPRNGPDGDNPGSSGLRAALPSTARPVHQVLLLVRGRRRGSAVDPPGALPVQPGRVRLPGRRAGRRQPHPLPHRHPRRLLPRVPARRGAVGHADLLPRAVRSSPSRATATSPPPASGCDPAHRQGRAGAPPRRRRSPTRSASWSPSWSPG